MNTLEKTILDNSFILYKPITPNNEPPIRKTYTFNTDFKKAQLFEKLITENTNKNLFKTINDIKFLTENHREQKAGNWFDVWKAFSENTYILSFALIVNGAVEIYNTIHEKLSNDVLPECEQPFDQLFSFLITQYNHTLTKLYVEFTNQFSFPHDIDEYDVAKLVNLGLIYPNTQQFTVSTESGNTVLYGICLDYNGVVEMKLFKSWYSIFERTTLLDFLTDCVDNNYKLNQKTVVCEQHKINNVALKETFLFGTDTKPKSKSTLVYVVDSTSEGRD